MLILVLVKFVTGYKGPMDPVVDPTATMTRGAKVRHLARLARRCAIINVQNTAAYRSLTTPRDRVLFLNNELAAMNLSTNELALYAGTGKSNVKRWLKQKEAPRANKGRPDYLTALQSESLVRVIRDASNANRSMNKTEVAAEMLVIARKSNPAAVAPHPSTVLRWLTSRPELKAGAALSVDATRSSAATQDNIEQWRYRVEQVIKIRDADPRLIYNMDETMVDADGGKARVWFPREHQRGVRVVVRFVISSY